MDWNNPEERREYYRKYYEANKEKFAERKRRYREAHKEEIREVQHKYYEANKERLAEQARLYRRTPRDRANRIVNAFKQKDTKYNRGECTITTDWIMENIFTSKCYYCGETDWKKLSCDRIDNSLPHIPENVVCCCGACNKKRGAMPFDKFVAECKKAGEIVTYLNRPDKSKPVVALNDAGETVYKFPSTAEAGRNGYNQVAVAAACRGCYLREGNHQYKGFFWFYK